MIDLLLPIYNGANYIEEQIASLEAQTFKDFRIIIRDDGSTDNSKEVVHRVHRNNSNITIIEDNLGNVGLSRCLEILMNSSTAPYYMFCDQDDKWKPEKIEKTFLKMRELEKSYPNKPVLVCTDSTCVDNHGNILAESFFKSQKYIDVIGDETKMLALNVVQGNTCLMNEACKQYILPFPKYGLYDHWAGVMICHYGVVHYLYEQTLWYRQHAGNVLGANNVGMRYFSAKFLHIQRQYRTYRSFFKHLPFHVSFWEWVYYKIVISMKRL